MVRHDECPRHHVTLFWPEEEEKQYSIQLLLVKKTTLRKLPCSEVLNPQK